MATEWWDTARRREQQSDGGTRCPALEDDGHLQPSASSALAPAPVAPLSAQVRCQAQRDADSGDGAPLPSVGRTRRPPSRVRPLRVVWVGRELRLRRWEGSSGRYCGGMHQENTEPLLGAEVPVLGRAAAGCPPDSTPSNPHGRTKSIDLDLFPKGDFEPRLGLLKL